MNEPLEILDKKDSINTKEVSIEKKKSDTPDEAGYFKVTIKDLPSRGLFYPSDVYISVMPAGVKEIKHWSMIDERDDYSFVEAMDFVLNSCCRIKTKSGILTIKDLCEVDRLYLIFTIRDYTFNDSSNDVILDVPYMFDGEEYKDSVKITKDNLSYFEIPEKLMKLYNEGQRAFIFDKFKIKLPTVGVSTWVQDYAKQRVQNNKPIDEFFVKCASFLIDDYANITNELYKEMEVDSIGWTIQQISGLDRIITEISKGAVPSFKHKTSKGGLEVNVPLNFRNGIKSIFIISDILGID